MFEQNNFARKGLHHMIANQLHNQHISLENKKILDIGCGDGAFLKKYCKSKNSKLYGIDGFYENTDPSINYFTYDLNENFSDKITESFDVIFLLDVIEHVHNQYHLINQINNILPKKGILVISTPNIYSFLGKLSFVCKEKLRGFGDINVHSPDGGPGHLNPFIPNIFLTYYQDVFLLKHIAYNGFIVPIFNKFIATNSKHLSGNITLFLEKK